jgi:phage terminase large subunit
VDYGTVNDMVFLDAVDDGENLWITREYRWASRSELRQKTDKEYADDFMDFMGDRYPCAAIVDPSAASFIQELQSRGVYVVKADNDVIDGIRHVSTMMRKRRIKVNEGCVALLDELGTYSWDMKAAESGVEKPIKQADHGADALRYLVQTALPPWRYET